MPVYMRVHDFCGSGNALCLSLRLSFCLWSKVQTGFPSRQNNTPSKPAGISTLSCIRFHLTSPNSLTFPFPISTHGFLYSCFSLALQCALFFPPLQTSTLAPQTDLSARTTAASLCAGCVTGIMTAGMTRMSPTPPVQVDKDSFILGRFGGFFLFMT